MTALGTLLELESICMVSANRPQESRNPIKFGLTFKSDTLEEFIDKHSTDLSKAGVFIRMKKPLSVGVVLQFRLALRDSSPLIVGQGTVVWRRLELSPGMGVRFDSLSDNSVARLSYILSKGRGSISRFDTAELEPNDDTTPPHRQEFDQTPTLVAPDELMNTLSKSAEDEKSIRSQAARAPTVECHVSEKDDNFEEQFRVATTAYVRGELELALAVFEKCQAMRPGSERVSYNIERLKGAVK